jgi:uncharacterized membrane protein YcaP (DUF421 family)
MATITKGELALAKARGSQQDAQILLAALEADGDITVVDDPEVEFEQDEEGEDIVEQQIAVASVVQIEVESVEEEEEEEEEE